VLWRVNSSTVELKLVDFGISSVKKRDEHTSNRAYSPTAKVTADNEPRNFLHDVAQVGLLLSKLGLTEWEAHIADMRGKVVGSLEAFIAKASQTSSPTPAPMISPATMMKQWLKARVLESQTDYPRHGAELSPQWKLSSFSRIGHLLIDENIDLVLSRLTTEVIEILIDYCRNPTPSRGRRSCFAG